MGQLTGPPLAKPGWRLLSPTVLAGVAFLIGPGQAVAFTLREIGEWVVSCDNTGACSAVNASGQSQLRVAHPSPSGTSRLCIHRDPGADAGLQLFVTLRAAPQSDRGPRDRGRLVRLVRSAGPSPDIALRDRGLDHWDVPQVHSRALSAAMDDEAQVHIVTPDGTTLERLPLDGIRRVISIMDGTQHSAGPGAALAHGSGRPLAAGRRPSPEPLVTASLQKLTPAPTPSPSALRLRREACGEPALDASTAYRLLGDSQRVDRILWVTPCNRPESPGHSLFVIEGAGGSAEPVAFPGSAPVRPTGLPGVVSTAEIDAEAGLVRELWRRSPTALHESACLIQRLWGWNGRRFELAEERRSLSCASAATGYWPRTYTRPLIRAAPIDAVATAQPFRPPC